jgi:hypothetical protein
VGEQIVDQTVGVLGAYLSRAAAGAALGAADMAARAVRDLVAERLRRTGDGDVLTALGHNPNGAGERADLAYVVRKLVSRDAVFASRLSAALNELGRMRFRPASRTARRCASVTTPAPVTSQAGTSRRPPSTPTTPA